MAKNTLASTRGRRWQTWIWTRPFEAVKPVRERQ